MKRIGSLLLTLLATVFAASPALAQVDTGSILGTVHDKSGGVVPGATVTVRETTTNTVVTASIAIIVSDFFLTKIFLLF